MAQFNDFWFAPRFGAELCAALVTTETTMKLLAFTSLDDALMLVDPFYGMCPPGLVTSTFVGLETCGLLVNLYDAVNSWQFRADVDCALWRLSLTRPEEF